MATGAVTEAGRGKWSMNAVGALSERPSTSAGGRSESAPTKGTRRDVGSRKTFLAGLLLQPLGLRLAGARRAPLQRRRAGGMPEAGKRFWLDFCYQPLRFNSCEIVRSCAPNGRFRRGTSPRDTAESKRLQAFRSFSARRKRVAHRKYGSHLRLRRCRTPRCRPPSTRPSSCRAA